jgi:hypothetical protein
MNARLQSLGFAVGATLGVYALDHAGKTVYAWDGFNAPVRYTAGAFTNTPTTQPWQLAIGPDGTAFSDNGNHTVEDLPLSGGSSTLNIPSPSGSGVVDALFDGGNGYVYAVVNDGVNTGTMDVVRISR